MARPDPLLSGTPDIVDFRKNFDFKYLDNMYVYLPENSNLVSGEHDLDEGARGYAPTSSVTGTYEFRKKFAVGIFREAADMNR